MTPEKIHSVVASYRKRLEEMDVPKTRIDVKKTFKQVSDWEALAHAHFLLDGIDEFADNPEKKRRAGSHLTVVQMIFSYAGFDTLENMMNLNRPDES